MKFIHALAGALLAAAAHHAGAQGASKPVPAAPRASAAAAPAAMPLVDGEVQEVDMAKGLIVLKHADLPSLAMPPMTMGFEVADKKMLRGLKVGDKVRFQAAMVKGEATVTELKRTR